MKKMTFLNIENVEEHYENVKDTVDTLININYETNTGQIKGYVLGSLDYEDGDKIPDGFEIQEYNPEEWEICSLDSRHSCFGYEYQGWKE